MIDDALLKLSDGQAITTSAYSTNTIDLLQARDIGQGEKLMASVRIDTAFAGGTSLTVLVIAHRTEDLTTDLALGAVSVLAASETFATAYLEANRYIDMSLGEISQVKVDGISVGFGDTAGLRYITISYIVTGTYTAGTVTSKLVTQSSVRKRVYPASTSMV